MRAITATRCVTLHGVRKALGATATTAPVRESAPALRTPRRLHSAPGPDDDGLMARARGAASAAAALLCEGVLPTLYCEDAAVVSRLRAMAGASELFAVAGAAEAGRADPTRFAVVEFLRR